MAEQNIPIELQSSYDTLEVSKYVGRDLPRSANSRVRKLYNWVTLDVKGQQPNLGKFYEKLLPDARDAIAKLRKLDATEMQLAEKLAIEDLEEELLKAVKESQE